MAESGANPQPIEEETTMDWFQIPKQIGCFLGKGAPAFIPDWTRNCQIMELVASLPTELTACAMVPRRRCHDLTEEPCWFSSIEVG